MRKTADKYIGIYADAGVDFGILKLSIEKHLDDTDLGIKLIQAKDILNDALDPDHMVAFFLPGAENGSQYREKLPSGLIGEKLYQYIYDGGVFPTECAGSHHACLETKFNTNDPDPTKHKFKKGLGLFQTAAVGPMDGLLHHDHRLHQGWYKTAVTTISYGDGKIGKALYWGGPQLEDISQDPAIEVIGRYHDLPDQPVAIAKKKIGDGYAFFSGPHACIDADIFYNQVQQNTHKTKEFGIAVAEKLRHFKESQTELFHHMMEEILNPYHAKKNAPALALKI